MGKRAQHAHVALQINAYNIAREQPFVCQNLYLRVKITQVWNGDRARFAFERDESSERNRRCGHLRQNRPYFYHLRLSI